MQVITFALIAAFLIVGSSATTHKFVYGDGHGVFYNDRNGKKYSAYSGDKQHYNQQKFMCKKNHGPLPNGDYKIVSVYTHPRLGEQAAQLEPFKTNDMCGRNDFFVHGKKGEPKIVVGSMGCIIVDRECRNALRAGDVVQVIANRPKNPIRS